MSLTGILNAKLSLKSVAAVLSVVIGASAGAIKLTDWAEHRVTTDEQAVGEIADSVKKIQSAVAQETGDLTLLTRDVAVHEKADEDWETRVNDTIHYILAKINPMPSGARKGP